MSSGLDVRSGLNRLALFFKIEFPTALPSIFGGIKVASILAVAGAVVGEFVGSSEGLGNAAFAAVGRVDTAMVFATVIVLMVLGVAVFLMAGAAQAIFAPWTIRNHFDR